MDERTPRRQLGRILRKARRDAGLTQAEVAARLNCGQAKVNKIETTLVAVSIAELDRLIAIYGIDQEKGDELRAIAAEDRQHARRASSAPAWRAFGMLSDLEPDALEILCWHSERIPGPLQSEHYMLWQFRTDARSSADVTNLMRSRKARARIFTMEDAPYYRAILSESSLYRMPGGRQELIVDQAEHLLVLMRQSARLTLQILPFAARLSFVDTDFEVMRFAGDEPDFAYLESPGGARMFKVKKDLARFVEHWHQLQAAALSPDASEEFLSELAKRMTSDPPHPLVD